MSAHCGDKNFNELLQVIPSKQCSTVLTVQTNQDCALESVSKSFMLYLTLQSNIDRRSTKTVFFQQLYVCFSSQISCYWKLSTMSKYDWYERMVYGMHKVLKGFSSDDALTVVLSSFNINFSITYSTKCMNSDILDTQCLKITIYFSYFLESICNVLKLYHS